jgi:hypothetical protein
MAMAVLPFFSIKHDDGGPAIFSLEHGDGGHVGFSLLPNISIECCSSDGKKIYY